MVFLGITSALIIFDRISHKIYPFDNTSQINILLLFWREKSLLLYAYIISNHKGKNYRANTIRKHYELISVRVPLSKCKFCGNS